MTTRKPSRPKTHSAATAAARFDPPRDSDLYRSGPAGDTNHIYGLVPVLEALRASNNRLEQITIAEGARHERLRELLDLAKQARVPVHRAPKFSLDRTLPGVTHQGVIARTAAATYRDPDELLDELGAQVGTAEPPLALGLDAVEDPRNLGAILRTAECAGVGGVFIPERRAVGLTATVAKAAAGALEHVSVARVTNLVQLMEQLKQRNIWVIGAAADGTSDYTDWDWTVPSALFLGGEGSGLHRLVRERCDALVRIPLRGRIESLNVSVAAGVILYEALRQRTAGKLKR
ncbi:MAG TPA: 23S rRNA (guanosine(2251)-2'-O)-methyltransferase RlmB [Pyrinomonadaceae bacterium]|jgi:23S rRNA (guanosine2251-2'-O)-methyltransferase|nr:23S rRNA (guanosine(2251)-2'-O)-methyltransferase RlmB [Pyrinomonadaceae bacterium]